MAFIGNIVGAYAAQQIGEYNATLYNQQAAYADAKAQQQRAAYNQLDKPRLVNQQQRDYSQFFVSRMLTGAEFSGTAFDAALDFQVNQALDLSIADYNESIEYDEAINQSLLLESKGVGENFKGQLTARAEYMKAAGSMIGNYSSSGSILSS